MVTTLQKWRNNHKQRRVQRNFVFIWMFPVSKVLEA